MDSQTTPRRPIFRPEALRSYRESREKQAFLKLGGTHAFAYFMAALACLVIGASSLALVRAPVYVEARPATGPDSNRQPGDASLKQPGDASLKLTLPSANAAWLRAGQRVFFELPGRGVFRGGAVTCVEPAGAEAVATVKLDPEAASVLAQRREGEPLKAQIETDERRRPLAAVLRKL